MINAEIRTGGKEVLASGSVILLDRSQTQITLGKLKFDLQFLADKAKQKGEMEWGPLPTNPDHGYIKFYNWEAPFGGFTGEPCDLGTFEGKALLAMFSIQTAQVPADARGPLRVDYTFYLGGAA